MKINGTIEAIEQSQGMSEKTGKHWTRWCYTIDGKKLSSFDRDIAKEFKLGDTVIVDVEQKGVYLNMIGMQHAESEDVQPTGLKPEVPKAADNQVVELLRMILAELKELNQNDKPAIK